MALDLQNVPRDTLRAVAFLSRIPVPARTFEGDDGSLADISRSFPLAGVLIALPAAAVLALCLWLGAGGLLAAALAVTALVVITGALHEDGLADTADGFFARGDREARLAIMKDSHNGTFGTLALVLSQSIRIAALAAIAGHSAATSVVALILSAAVSRLAMVWHWQALPSARPEGLAGKSGRPARSAVFVAAAMTLALVMLGGLMGMRSTPMAIALAAAGAAAAGFSLLCEEKIGGQTGDTIGATQQLNEIAMLAALAIAL